MSVSLRCMAALLLCSLATAIDNTGDKKGPLKPGYDFIVVGGGTAGSAFAARLSVSLPWASILLIEAGPSALDEDRINIPGRKGSTIGTVYDWNLTTTPQPGAKNRVFAAPRGKVLGGSSAMNLMSWDRASAPEYDAWGTFGNPGWNWKSMISAMKKVETFTPSPHYGTKGVGTSGPIKTAINRIIPSHQTTWIPTMNNLDVPLNLESLAGNPLGVMYQPSNIDPAPWNRSYVANTYLPLAGRNLHILTSTRVAKLNLVKSGAGTHTATGITLQNGTVIPAHREVILASGSLQSPGLLELSGIGSPAVLEAAGIPLLVDLPGVGANLQDHIRVQSSFRLKPEYTSFDVLRYNASFAAAQLALRGAGQPSMLDYTGSGYAFTTWGNATGDMLGLARAAVGASTHAVDRKRLKLLENPAVPQVEVIFSDGYTGVRGYPAPESPLYGEDFFTLIAGVMHPLSRGSVHISSSNISIPPVINPNYLSNEYDLAAAVAAAKYIRTIANTAPMRGIWSEEYEPGVNAVPEGAGEEQWRAWVKESVLSIFHPVGTCAMMKRGEGGVVDGELKVYGTGNVRVVDASVMPLLVAGHVQTAVYGVAERAAGLVAGRWKRG